MTRLIPRGVDGILLGMPGGNTGDDLIRAGCERFLGRSDLDVWSSDGTIERAAAAGDLATVRALLKRFRGAVFFVGGGNVGIYPDNERMRAAVISTAHAARGFLVLPQSCRAPESSLADPRVTVWARDAESRTMLDATGTRTELVPDAAFAMADTFAPGEGGAGTLFILRAPGTCDERVEPPVVPDGPVEDLTHRTPLDAVVARIGDFDTVVSDRLHGGLIAIMLGKRTALLPVGYHKIRSYHRTWFTGDPGIGYVESQADLAAFRASATPPSGDYAGGFWERARPALDAFLTRRR